MNDPSQVVYNSVVKLLTGNTRRLSHIKRYSPYPALRQESVAEHTYYVSFYCLWLADRAIAMGYKVSKDLLLSRAITHDIDESMIGDIIRPVKHSNPVMKEYFNKYSEDVVAHYDSELNWLGQLNYYYKNHKDDTIEGRILALADLMSVVSYTNEEISVGNTYMVEVLHASLKYFTDFIVRLYDIPVNYHQLFYDVLYSIYKLPVISSTDPRAIAYSQELTKYDELYRIYS